MTSLNLAKASRSGLRNQPGEQNGSRLWRIVSIWRFDGRYFQTTAMLAAAIALDTGPVTSPPTVLSGAVT